ncbi:hypothetical protein FOL47_010118, partial [Perkinsus chesapeaki]
MGGNDKCQPTRAISLPDCARVPVGDMSGEDLVKRACQRLGKSREEEATWSQYLKDQWLDGRGSLASLSESDWDKLRMPIGLRAELKKLVREGETKVCRSHEREVITGSKMQGSGNARLDGNFESPSWGGVDFSNKHTEMHGMKETN